MKLQKIEISIRANSFVTHTVIPVMRIFPKFFEAKDLG